MANKYIKTTNNESGTLTAQLTADETTTAHVTPVPDKAPGLITIEIGTSKEEEIYYVSKDDGAGTISTLTRDFSNLNGGVGQLHESGAAWETAQSASTINQMVDGLTTEHNASDGKHKSALVTTLKATGAEINTGTEDAKIVTPKAMKDAGFVLDADGTLAANSDSKIATQKAVKTYVGNNSGNPDPLSADALNAKTTNHITITPGTSKLVKIAVLEQGNTTNTYRNNAIILTGWGFLTGDGSNVGFTKANTFGITFSTAPVVVVSSAGEKDSSDPTAITDGAQLATSMTRFFMTTYGISTGGFTTKGARVDGASGDNNRRFLYTWIAIGTLT